MTPEKNPLKSTDPLNFSKGNVILLNKHGGPGSMCSWKDDMQIPDVLPNSWDFRRLWCTLWHWGSSSAISDWNLPRRPRYRVGLPSFWSLQNPLTLRIRWLDFRFDNVAPMASAPKCRSQKISPSPTFVVSDPLGDGSDKRSLRKWEENSPWKRHPSKVEATNQNNNVNMQVAV